MIGSGFGPGGDGRADFFPPKIVRRMCTTTRVIRVPSASSVALDAKALGEETVSMVSMLWADKAESRTLILKPPTVSLGPSVDSNIVYDGICGEALLEVMNSEATFSTVPSWGARRSRAFE